jgi:hypothetical protein
LNPREPIIDRVQSSLARGETIDPAAIDALLVKQVENL